MLGSLLASVVTLAPVAPGTLTVDAFFDDWAEQRVFTLDRTARGSLAGPKDLVGRVQLALQGDLVFFALQVQDDLFQRGSLVNGDGAEIVYRGGAGQTTRLQIVLNELEGRVAELRRDGRPLKGALVASTTRKDGWAVEGSFPARELPGLQDGEIGLVVTVRDADYDPTQAEAVMATGPIGTDGLPALTNLRFDTALGAYGLYEAERGSAILELSRTRANVAGDDAAEDVVVNETDVVVAGRGLPDGATFYYFAHGWAPGSKVTRLDAQELDGRPGKELVIERESSDTGLRVSILEVYGIHDGVLKRRFGQKLAEVFTERDAELRSRFKVLPGKGKGAARFEITVAVAKNVTDFDYPRESPGPRSYRSLPLPWLEKRSRFYALEGESWQPASK